MYGGISNKAKVFRLWAMERLIFFSFNFSPTFILSFSTASGRAVFLTRHPRFPLVKDFNYIIVSGSVIMNGIWSFNNAFYHPKTKPWIDRHTATYSKRQKMLDLSVPLCVRCYWQVYSFYSVKWLLLPQIAVTLLFFLNNKFQNPHTVHTLF